MENPGIFTGAVGPATNFHGISWKFLRGGVVYGKNFTEQDFNFDPIDIHIVFKVYIYIYIYAPVLFLLTFDMHAIDVGR